MFFSSSKRVQPRLEVVEWFSAAAEQVYGDADLVCKGQKVVEEQDCERYEDKALSNHEECHAIGSG